MAREINLVPDIKGEMIKTLKLRNLIFFICAIVAASSIGVTIVFGLIAGGQQLAVDNKKGTIEKLSAKLKSYDDLNEFVTIRDQLGNISSLTSNKKVMSRTFNILSALIPKGLDSIIISDLDVNIAGEFPTFNMTAQANAGEEPFIDYRVLDAFNKSMRYMRYDYGNYVDKEGNIIPAYCMIETGPDGAFLSDGTRGLYAYWSINKEGCNPASEAANESTNEGEDGESTTGANTNTNTSSVSYATEDYDGQQVVRIWRTPQFADWYKETERSNEPYMDLNGNISGVEHFESACITYTGDNSENSTSPKWTETNDVCWLVPAGTDGIVINESSNGRNSEEELVLTFSATIALSPEVYNFNNSHMIALAPSGRHNVTDSYVQVQTMFGEKATKCAKDDEACNKPIEKTEEEVEGE